jgi:TPR repeat protein
MSFFKRILDSANTSSTVCSLKEGALKLADQVKLSIDNLETAAVKEVLEKAEAGDVQAQFDCGEMYFLGSSVPQDDFEALSWFERAAQQQHHEAQAHVAMLHALGRGTPKDNVESYKWARVAADGGNEPAVRLLQKLLTSMSSEEVAEGDHRSRDLARTLGSSNPGSPSVVGNESGLTNNKPSSG